MGVGVVITTNVDWWEWVWL